MDGALAGHTGAICGFGVSGGVSAPLLSLRSFFSVGVQRALDLYLPAEQHYFVVSPRKITSESCNHFDALNNVSVVGFESICKIDAGSGVGLGLRAVGCGPSFGIEPQALSAIEISAQLSIAARLFLREFIACFLSVYGVLPLLSSGLLLGPHICLRLAHFRLCGNCSGAPALCVPAGEERQSEQQNYRQILCAISHEPPNQVNQRCAPPVGASNRPGTECGHPSRMSDSG